MVRQSDDKSSRRGWSEEEIVVPSQDRHRSSQREWPRRSRSPYRPSRQDSFDRRAGPVVIRTRDRSWERSRSQPVQPSRQLSKVADRYVYLERPRSANAIGPRERTSEREEERLSPKMDEVVIRRNQSSKPRLHNGQYFSSSESEYSYNGSRVLASRVRREQSTVGPSGQSQAHFSSSWRIWSPLRLHSRTCAERRDTRSR